MTTSRGIPHRTPKESATQRRSCKMIPVRPNSDALASPAFPLSDEARGAMWSAKFANMARAWEHFDAGEVILESLPFRCSIELTQNCNFKCTMCAQSWDPRFARYDPALNMEL